MRFLSTVVLCALAHLVGCAQTVQRQPTGALPPAPYLPAQPVVFQAKLMSLVGCAPGQVLFAVPWANSPEYRPDVTFVRAPDPVATCVEFSQTLARSYLGRNVLLEKQGSLYRLHSATSALPASLAKP